MEQVDAFLDAVRDTFLGVRQPPLTAEEIRAKQFATTRLRPGYDEQDVDAFLEDVEARLRARCAECGAETGGAAQVCAVCGTPAVTRPSAAVDPIPETCLSCGTVTTEHLPGCPAEAAVKRARRWRAAALLTLLATGALLAVAGKLDHLHGRWVVAAGWVMVGCGLTLAVVEKTAEDRGRGPLLPKWLRVVTLVLLVYGFALLITQSHGGGGGGGGGITSSPVAPTRARGGSRTAAPAVPALSRYSRTGLESSTARTAPRPPARAEITATGWTNFPIFTGLASRS